MTVHIPIGDGTETVSITFTAAVVPAATTLVLGATTTTTVAVTWATPATGGSPITGYNLYAAPHGNPLTLVETVTPTNAYLFNGLVTDTEYDFAIEAVNAVGASDLSEILNASTAPPGTPPDAPILHASTVTIATIRVTWTAPASTSGILGYDLYRSLTGSEPTYVATIPAATSYTFAGLAADTSYDFAIKAINAVGGTGPASNILTVSTAASLSVPGAPTIITTPTTGTTVTITWSTPPDNGSAITGYKAFIAEHGDALVEAGTTDDATHTFTFTGLTDGVVYDVAVAATNAVGDGPPSPIVVVRPHSTPNPPVLIGVGATTTAITVRWDPPSPGGSPITAYKLYGAEAGDTQVLLDTVAAVPTRYTFAGLTPDTEYDFSIEAVNAVGPSARSATLTRSTVSVLDPGTVGDAEFVPFPGMPDPPPRWMRARVWDEEMTAVIADLPGGRTNHVEDLADGIGGGSLVMAVLGDDGEVDPLVNEILGGRVVQTQVWDEDDEVYANAYLWRVEDTPKVTIAPTQGQLVISPAGRGVAQDFEVSQVDPYGGVGKIPWGDMRSFGWQAPELNDSSAPWTAPNVRSIQALKTALPPYGLGGKPYGWPNPLSPWLWGAAPTDGHDAKGFSYFRYRFTLNRELDVTFYVSADDLFVASLNDVDIIDFQADKGDSAGSTYWRKLHLTPGDYTFACRVENLDRPGIAENCGLFNVCATYAISPAPTNPWLTMDTQRFLFTSAGWSAETFALTSPAGFHVEPAGNADGFTVVYYATASIHSTTGVWIPPGGGLHVNAGATAPPGFYVEGSAVPEGIEIIWYATEMVHPVAGVMVDQNSVVRPGSTAIVHDESVGHPHPQGWKSLAYPEAAPGMTAGQIILILLTEAQARGELPGWGITFNALVDSSNTPWPDVVPEFQCRVGTSYAEVFKQLEEQGYIHWAVSGDDLTLHVWAQSHDFGVQPATFSDGPDGNIVMLTHTDKWGLKRDKMMARTQDGWVRRGTGKRQATISIPDWTDKPKIEAYIDQQIVRTNDDASSVSLDYVPVSAATMPFVGFRVLQAVTLPNRTGVPYNPKVSKTVLDESRVGPPKTKIELESPAKVSEELMSKVQARTAPGAFDGRAASIAPYTKSQPQGGVLGLITIKFNLAARAAGAASNAISDGLTYADSADEIPSGRFKIQRAQLTAGSLQVEEAPYTGYSIVQLLYNGHIGQTLVLGPGEFQVDDYFGSNYVDPRASAFSVYPNWYLETGPLDSMKVQLVSAGTHRNLLYTLWGYEVP